MSASRRQEYYNRVRESSRDAVIREEMLRLGFWKPEDGPTQLTEDWLRRRGELAKEVNQLAAKQRRFKNREAMLFEMRKRRMAQSKAKQQETRERRLAEQKERAEAWAKRKEEDICYLGEGVSAGLENAAQQSGELFGIPPVSNIRELAQLLEVSVGELRFLSFHRKVSQTTHYRRFLMPKKSGGHRLISAPMPRLKKLQHLILEKILHEVPVHEAAHGFAPARSIVTNASQHVGKEVVVNMDMQNFFPTVTYRRVKGVFRKLGYPENVATVLSLICTEPEVDEIEMDGERYWLHKSERHLPQGAPTSPALTNILCYRLDKRMVGAAKSLGFDYSRYADDVTFSAGEEAGDCVRKMLWRARSIVEAEGFIVHPDKTRIMRRGSRQEVTGLVVNDRVSVPRQDLKAFRALLHQIEESGPEGKSWRGSKKHLLSVIRGFACFVRMVDPDKGKFYFDQVDRILVKHGWVHEIRHPRKTLKEGEGVAADSLENSISGTPKKQGKGGFLAKLKFWKR